MDINVIRRLRSGFTANICNQAVTVIVQIVGVPIFLYAWGTQLYGEWLVLFAIPAYLSMTDLGFSQSAANDMTARVARDDRDGSLCVFQSVIAFVYIALACVFLLTSLLVFGLPLEKWVNPGVMGISEVRWTLWLLAAEVFARLPDGINHAGFRSTGDYSLHMRLHSITRLTQFSGMWGAVIVGGGPVAAAGAFFGVRLIGTASFALLLKHRHPWLQYGIRVANRAELRRLFRPALANVAIPLAQGLNVQGMVLAVGAVLGPVAVVTFSTLRTLARLALQLAYAVGYSAEPEIASAYGAKNAVLFSSLFSRALSVGLWLSLSAAAGLAVFGGPILSIWTHGKVAMDNMLFAWLLMSSVASALWYAPLTVLKAANRHIRASAVLVFSAAGSLAVGLVFMQWTQTLASVGTALLLMDIAVASYTLNAASRITGTNLRSNLIHAFNPDQIVRGIIGKKRIN